MVTIGNGSGHLGEWLTRDGEAGRRVAFPVMYPVYASGSIFTLTLVPGGRSFVCTAICPAMERLS